jgi:hypothetical protein
MNIAKIVKIVLSAAVLACCAFAFVPSANAQCCQPTVTYYAPAPAVTYSVPSVVAPIGTYYAPAAAPVTVYHTPSVPVTTYYAPYYAPAPAAVVSPVVTYYRSPTLVYDPTRILPRRRWLLVY